MCGIVGVAGNLLAADKTIFTELLHADVVRGKHATGMIQVKGQCRLVDNFKLAYPAPLFLDLPVVQQELANFINNTVAVGHNRHATKGASGEHKNAHPFEHGHISMVHNGSLTSWHDLTPIGESYTVDSEAICRGLEVYGAEVIIPKLRGAFALVWINSEDNTLNFVRNEERPLAIAMNHSVNKMWWASEMDMLKWVLDRDVLARNPAVYGEMFELPVGMWLKIPITHVGVNLGERTLTPIDVSDSVTAYSYGGYTRNIWDPKRGRHLRGNETLLPEKKPEEKSGNVVPLLANANSSSAKDEKVTQYSFGPTREAQMRKDTAKIIDEKGKSRLVIREFISSIDMDVDAAILDDRIGMFVTKWEPYSASDSHGTLHGIMMEKPYSKLKIFNITETEYKDITSKANGMITSYLIGFDISEGASSRDMSDEAKASHGIILRRDQIRKANLDDFNWQMDKVPTDFTAGEVVAKTKATSPSRVAVLKDDSKVNPTGTAIYIGKDDGVLFNGYRYPISNIELMDRVMMLSVTLKDIEYMYPWSEWEEGKLHEQIKAEKTLVVGHDNCLLELNEWVDLVDEGCAHCNEPMNDHEKADSLYWLSDTEYLCGPCHFDLVNMAY